MQKHLFFVSRQCYWGVDPSEQNVVEVAQGGLDYANADMLCVAYPKLDEGETFKGMTPAVEAAIKIAEAWKKDKPELEIHVAAGSTMGFTMPFVGGDHPDDTQKLLEEAKEFDEKLPKCPVCGEIDELTWSLVDDAIGEKFCSEECCWKAEYANAAEERVCELEEASADLSMDDLIEIANLSQSQKTEMANLPEDERRDWVIREMERCYDQTQLLEEIEDKLSSNA